MSRLGLLLCAPYAVFILACVGIVSLGAGDDASQLVFLQLPIAGQLVVVQALGLGRAIAFLSWPDAYGLLVMPVFVLLYAVGGLCEWALARRRGPAPAHSAPDPGRLSAGSARPR
ncbi:hypothetical protein RCH14_003427 [Massilia sp. MP_M2]|uniref:hypothetical protein n=1 Tax=Massilia sp. MP_M2 TaxID=3071713 RepID=UPI00319D981A